MSRKGVESILRIILIFNHRVAVTSMFLSLMQEVGQDENYKEVVKKYRARHLYELKKINRAYRVTYSPEDVVYKEGQPNGVHVKVDEKGEVTEYVKGENGEFIELFEKTHVYCSQEGKAEEQKIPTFEIVTIDERYPIEPDIVQEAREVDENVIVGEPSNVEGSLRSSTVIAEADSVQEARMEVEDILDGSSKKTGSSIVFRRNGDAWTVMQPPMVTQKEDENDRKLWFDPPGDNNNVFSGCDDDDFLLHL